MAAEMKRLAVVGKQTKRLSFSVVAQETRRPGVAKVVLKSWGVSRESRSPGVGGGW